MGKTSVLLCFIVTVLSTTCAYLGPESSKGKHDIDDALDCTSKWILQTGKWLGGKHQPNNPKIDTSHGVVLENWIKGTMGAALVPEHTAEKHVGNEHWSNEGVLPEGKHAHNALALVLPEVMKAVSELSQPGLFCTKAEDHNEDEGIKITVILAYMDEAPPVAGVPHVIHEPNEYCIYKDDISLDAYASQLHLPDFMDSIIGKALHNSFQPHSPAMPPRPSLPSHSKIQSPNEDVPNLLKILEKEM